MIFTVNITNLDDSALVLAPYVRIGRPVSFMSFESEKGVPSLAVGVRKQQAA